MKVIAAMLAMVVSTGAVSASPAVTYYPAPAVQGRTAPFSSAVRVGDVMYLSGQIGLAPDGKLPATFEGQAKQTMDNVGAALKARQRGLEGSKFHDELLWLPASGQIDLIALRVCKQRVPR